MFVAILLSAKCVHKRYQTDFKNVWTGGINLMAKSTCENVDKFVLDYIPCSNKC